MRTFLNDQPFEHTSRYGTRFTGERCDFKNGVTVTFPDGGLSEDKKLSDVGEFYAWHAVNIWGQLNGFSGYDCVSLTIQGKQPQNPDEIACSEAQRPLQC